MAMKEYTLKEQWKQKKEQWMKKINFFQRDILFFIIIIPTSFSLFKEFLKHLFYSHSKLRRHITFNVLWGGIGPDEYGGFCSVTICTLFSVIALL